MHLWSFPWEFAYPSSLSIPQEADRSCSYQLSHANHESINKPHAYSTYAS